MKFEFTDDERLHIASKLLGAAKRKFRDLEDAKAKGRHEQLIISIEKDARESQRLAGILSNGGEA